MREFLKSFFARESGAVTVDWVVLTAAVAALAFAGYASIQNATGGVGSGVGGYLQNKEIE